MHFRSVLHVTLAASLLFFPSQVRGESPSDAGAFSDAKFVLHVDVDGIRERSKIGSMLLDLVKSEALKEIAEKTAKDGHESDPEATFEKFTEMLGFDPFTEIQSLTISAGDYEHPENSLVATVHMKETTGNLEGLMLGLPGYESSEYRDHQVHSIAPDSEHRIYGAIVDGSEGKTILVSSDKTHIEGMIDGGVKERSSARRTHLKKLTSGDPLVSVQVLDIPMDKLGEGPHANIAKLLDGLALQVSEEDDELSVGVLLSTTKENQAEQIRQMAQGLIAMVEFAQSAEPEDKDLKKVKDLAREVTAKRDGSEVSVGIKVSTKKLMELIEEEIEDKHGDR